MIVLGLSGALGHDASAALIANGEIIAAAEEERFIRDKHAKGKMPVEAARYCLTAAGVNPADVDVVAFPYASIPLSSPARWHYAKRYWYAPDRALDASWRVSAALRVELADGWAFVADMRWSKQAAAVPGADPGDGLGRASAWAGFTLPF